jgi:putative ABC transport system permease protein
MNSLLLDFQAASRFFLRRRAAFAVIVLTMALAIGANTAVFSVLKAFLFSSLAVPESERVVIVWTARDLPGRGRVNFNDAFPNYKLLAETTRSFASIGTTLLADLNWQQQDNARRLQGVRATASYFDVMRVQPVLGRLFTRQEEGPGAAPVVLISHALWQGSFAGAPDVLGRMIRLNGVPCSIIGVLPPGFAQPPGTEVCLPFDLPENMWNAIVGGRQLVTYARLADGVTPAMADAELKEFTKRAIEMDANNKEWTWVVQELRSVLLAGADNAIIFVQTGAAVLLVLAICNLASLLMAWAAERQRETAVRLALGASGWRLVRQFLVQSLALAAVGGGLGVLLAALSLPVLQELNPSQALGFYLAELELDGSTLAFAALLVLGTGLLAGLLPAWQSQAISFLEALRSESRGASLSRGALRWQQAMVVVQSAVSVLILVGAGLAGLGFYQLKRAQLGFVADGRVALHFQFPEPGMATHEQRARMVRELEANLAREPALLNYGVVSSLPVGDIQWGGGFSPQLSSGDYTPEVSVFHFRRASPTYLSTMGVPLLAGRMLNDRDRGDTTPVVVISKALADKYWPGEDPIGRKLKRASTVGGLSPFVEIVGVVGNVLDAGAGLPAGETVYVPYEQQSLRRSWMVLQARGSIEDAIAAGRRALHATDPGIAAFDIATLTRLSRQANALPRLQVTLLGVFAVIAVGITALGSYGVMSQLVANRQKELAIRAALGATQGGVLRLVLWQNARLAGAGTLLGLVGAWFVARATESQLTGFDASPLWPYFTVGAGVLLLTQLASLLPAHRAAKLEVQSVLASA